MEIKDMLDKARGLFGKPEKNAVMSLSRAQRRSAAKGIRKKGDLNRSKHQRMKSNDGIEKRAIPDKLAKFVEQGRKTVNGNR